ncbi:cell division topological specificity factor MinE [Saccharobesus litoralis]|uniref:Cell division topological specificity factor n=1 Tax=Saccharobesus litoralis TaxID=2172099 RepID=A0A2S0VUS1_9ALTE|nr:cell division topological specificity factor MinE [Saccharobesus litoralis]AWB67933.1 cell division topological specificity factor MinE [Saccharobesus litoralis]
MSLLNYFRKDKKPAASVAKERLQIIVAHERNTFRHNGPDYLPDLERDILAVIRKYVDIDTDAVSVQLDQKNDDLSVLELNVTLPDEK